MCTAQRKLLGRSAKSLKFQGIKSDSLLYTNNRILTVNIFPEKIYRWRGGARKKQPTSLSQESANQICIVISYL